MDNYDNSIIEFYKENAIYKIEKKIYELDCKLLCKNKIKLFFTRNMYIHYRDKYEILLNENYKKLEKMIKGEII